jgi:hypothetical protein
MSILGDLISLFTGPAAVDESITKISGGSNVVHATNKKKKKGKKAAPKGVKGKSVTLHEDSAGDGDLDTDGDGDSDVPSVGPIFKPLGASRRGKGKGKGHGNMFDASESETGASPVSALGAACSVDADEESEEDTVVVVQEEVDDGLDEDERKAMDIATSQYLAHHMGKSTSCFLC